ncbi:nuclear transport factor 2 family protein [Flammeovirga sp. SJP92]|uniref:nuclear transport factor 2 family protein n=1 Tax=Flammeovirga sp. SJP92 TaxID=1775430 RepID=UPI000787B871|nr:nuclear transport factor 2 family protein [Flammeovirga sp. SJP92]KXX67239.1 hypothetical protein AVL50_28035 [Flammeovirga sp. SJP92]
MKSLFILLFSLLTLGSYAQSKVAPAQTVTQLFIATDQKDWQQVEDVFNEKVVLDYSSMNNNPATSLSPQAITTAWKTILPGFEHTHHQVGNFITEIKGNQATVFCYGTAKHYLPDDNGNVWTVVGSYDFELIKSGKGNWKISSMKFNYKYQDGNTSLPSKAIQKVK